MIYISSVLGYLVFKKMNELNSAEISLNDQTKFRLNKINKIKDYFNSEI